MLIGSYILTALVAYLLGSLPTGYWVGRTRGLDIRQSGSGNIGATNVFRVLGKKAGIFVLLVDALKGYAACGWLAPWMAHRFYETPTSLLIQNHLLIGGVFAILGHNYTFWLGFKGGKGIATSAGVLAALNGVGFLVTLSVWLVVFAISRYVSLASIVAAFALPFAFWWSGASNTFIAITAFLGAMAIYKHKANIQRLLAGTENRVGQKKSAQPNPEK